MWHQPGRTIPCYRCPVVMDFSSSLKTLPLPYCSQTRLKEAPPHPLARRVACGSPCRKTGSSPALQKLPDLIAAQILQVVERKNGAKIKDLA